MNRGLKPVATAALLLCAGTVPADSLWQAHKSISMFADSRGTRVGDILTILVQENTTATLGNNTTTSKTSAIDASIASFFYNGLLAKSGSMPALNLNNKSTFAGGGSINNSQQIVASVAVRIIDVLPNHNLVIEGSREGSFSGEKQTVVLRGTVREDDVMANNTIYSYNISDATIRIVSKGVISDAQRKGWFHKLWDKVAPF
jgi:flagellar L-ring protein precursor FlgH